MPDNAAGRAPFQDGRTASHKPPDGTPRPPGTYAAPQRERIVGPPPNPFPVEEPAPGTAHPTPPIGGWWAHYPAKSRSGWHVACPSCLAGRVLLAPDPADPFGYLIRPATCTAGCPALDVMRAFAWREGDMDVFFRWLDRQRPAGRAAA